MYKLLENYWKGIFLSGVTSHYVIDQSMISICEMKEMLGGEFEDKHNPWYSTQTLMQINHSISNRQNSNIVIKYTSRPCWHKFRPLFWFYSSLFYFTKIKFKFSFALEEEPEKYCWLHLLQLLNARMSEWYIALC